MKRVDRGLRGWSRMGQMDFRFSIFDFRSAIVGRSHYPAGTFGHCSTEERSETRDWPTEVTRTVQARRVQGFFRSAVLAAYENRCAISGLAVPELLKASHIIPWCENVERRADPRNGICLNALYDRAFDRGLIAFDGDLRVLVSPKLKKAGVCGEAEAMLATIEGRPLNLPGRFTPDREAMAWHRATVFSHV